MLLRGIYAKTKTNVNQGQGVSCISRGKQSQYSSPLGKTAKWQDTYNLGSRE